MTWELMRHRRAERLRDAGDTPGIRMSKTDMGRKDLVLVREDYDREIVTALEKALAGE